MNKIIKCSIASSTFLKVITIIVSFLLIIALLYICVFCDFLPSWRTIYVVNRSSTKQVALLGITVDGENINYQESSLAKQRFLTTKRGKFKSRPKRHWIEVLLQKKDSPPEKYSCQVQSISDHCTIGVSYYDDGIECGFCISIYEETEGMS